MDAVSISKALEGRPRGGFFSLTMKVVAQTYKTVTQVIEKETVMTGQLCDYSVRAPVKDAVAEGERDAPELPKHISHAFMQGSVKFWMGNNGTVYFPMPLVNNAKKKVTWFLEGEPVEYAEVEPYLMAASKPKKHKTNDELAELGQVAFVAIKVENIQEVR